MKRANNWAHRLVDLYRTAIGNLKAYGSKCRNFYKTIYSI